MTSRLSLFFITLLLLLSIALRNPILFLLGALMALVAGASALWGRYCLAGVAYDRRFGSTPLVCGEETDGWVEIVNAKRRLELVALFGEAGRFDFDVNRAAWGGDE